MSGLEFFRSSLENFHEDKLAEIMERHQIEYSKENRAFKDNLEEISPELRVLPRFDNMCRAFDKEFSLCANYPKGWGSNFRQWMLFHVGVLVRVEWMWF